MFNKLIGFYLSHTPRMLQRFTPALTSALSFAYKGNSVECPVCGMHFREFLPFERNGETHRNVLCPKCNSIGSFRFMEMFLRSVEKFYEPGRRVLHVAPERCFIEKFESVFGDGYVTADLSSKLAKVQVNVEEMPFPDGYFDVVLCNHVLEHVGDDRRAMREIARVLRPGGWAMLQVPIDKALERTYEDPSITSPAERMRHFGQSDHLRKHGRDYPDRLREAGFRVEEVRFADALDEEQIARYALVPEEVLYICKL
jgi:SAM-dependent methyltransferase